MEPRAIGLIGLGLMGTALAKRLLADYRVVGYDVDAVRLQAFGRCGGRAAAGHGEVTSSCDRLLLSLPTTEVVEEVLRQMDAQLRPDQILIDTTTGDPQKTAALGARLAARGVGYLDATLSGSSAEADRGQVIVMAGGQRDVFEACEDLFRCFARRWFHVGDWGSGSKMKLVGNLVLGLNRAALAEGLALARRMGLDAQSTLAIMAESAAYSRVMDTKGQKMITGDFTPQAKLSQHLKDVRLILAEGVRSDASLPFSQLHRQLLEDLEAAGFGDVDNSAIIRTFDGPAFDDAGEEP